MIHANPLKQRIMSIFATFALLLQVAVPVGFMPASVAGGWYLELCPQGLPTHVVVALFGEHHAHHASAGENTFNQCDYGAGSVAGASLLDCSASSWDFSTASDHAGAVLPTVATDPHLLGFQSRAPPYAVRYRSNTA